MCKHLKATQERTGPVKPSSHGCKECLESGGRWVHLRLCMTCGHVGCCDNSPNRHATRHHHATQHPVIKSFEPGEAWGWCYVDDAMVKVIPPIDGEESPTHHYAPPGVP